MLEHVMLLNLQAREDKFYYALGWLARLDFPFGGRTHPWGDTIIRYIAHDGSDYKDKTEVIDAAVADGFTYFDKFYYIKLRDIAWCWTWAAALRKIVDMKKTVLLLIDDCLPMWEWYRLRLLTNSCYQSESDHGEFRALQLNTKPPHCDITPVEPEPYSYMLAKGFYGKGDYGFILNALGAQMLLDMQSQLCSLPPRIICEIAKRGLNSTEYFSGLWHTLDKIVQNEPGITWKSDLYR